MYLNDSVDKFHKLTIGSRTTDNDNNSISMTQPGPENPRNSIDAIPGWQFIIRSIILDGYHQSTFEDRACYCCLICDFVTGKNINWENHINGTTHMEKILNSENFKVSRCTVCNLNILHTSDQVLDMLGSDDHKKLDEYAEKWRKESGYNEKANLPKRVDEDNLNMSMEFEDVDSSSTQTLPPMYPEKRFVLCGFCLQHSDAYSWERHSNETSHVKAIVGTESIVTFVCNLCGPSHFIFSAETNAQYVINSHFTMNHRRKVTDSDYSYITHYVNTANAEHSTLSYCNTLIKIGVLTSVFFCDYCDAIVGALHWAYHCKEPSHTGVVNVDSFSGLCNLCEFKVLGDRHKINSLISTHVTAVHGEETVPVPFTVIPLPIPNDKKSESLLKELLKCKITRDVIFCIFCNTVVNTMKWNKHISKMGHNSQAAACKSVGTCVCNVCKFCIFGEKSKCVSLINTHSFCFHEKDPHESNFAFYVNM